MCSSCLERGATTLPSQNPSKRKIHSRQALRTLGRREDARRATRANTHHTSPEPSRCNGETIHINDLCGLRCLARRSSGSVSRRASRKDRQFGCSRHSLQQEQFLDKVFDVPVVVQRQLLGSMASKLWFRSCSSSQFVGFPVVSQRLIPMVQCCLGKVVDVPVVAVCSCGSGSARRRHRHTTQGSTSCGQWFCPFGNP